MGVKDSLLSKLLGSADRYSDEQVAQTITMLLEHGVKRSATDIHIEPFERTALVRYRIDGHLRGIHRLPLVALPAIVAECKRLAGLSVESDGVPHEGQYSTLVGEDSFRVQLTTVPVVGGEKVVLHLARQLDTPLSLEQLGFWGHNLQLIKQTISRPQGVVLVSGPKRSGKATTMHSILNLINTPSVSVATVETSITYRLRGASQTVAKPHAGMPFHEGLRAVLNQDPNVIMTSTIPDRQTAELVVQAGTGGHLIIAGLYADSAPNALVHLRQFHPEPFLLASSLRIVTGQRLVRRLCDKCRVRKEVDGAYLADLENTFGVNNATARRRLHELEQQAAVAGVGTNRQFHTTPSKITHIWQAHEEGCEACDHTGFRSLIALTEVLQVTHPVQQAILDHGRAPEIHKIALKEGFIPLGLDGLVKALRGETTIEEVLRTVQP
jgi:type IV pilus assembly protein PilB